MCGIAGIIDYMRQNKFAEQRIRSMTSAMHHRGPDSSNVYLNGAASFGHTRLSIIDLSECSNQPMPDASGRYRIIFNGEIYNYRELRSRLSAYPFSSDGDTETIIAAYSTWGTDCVKELNGMFAFAIWDEEEQTLFAARDRLGVKPFYYYEDEGIFIFASEMKSLLASGLIDAQLDYSAASEFLQFQSITFPHTILKNVSSLEAGTWMLLSNGRKVIGKYWNILDGYSGFDFNDAMAVKATVARLVTKSVERRMVSDVPVAAFLSGGIDSSVIVALMASLSAEPVNTFNVAFNEKDFDESAYAGIIAKKYATRHECIRLTPRELLNDLVPALDVMDSPSGDGVNSYVVSKAIRKHNIKVALSGTGGDELFAGYPIFKQYVQLMRAGDLWNIAKPIRRLMSTALANRNGKLERYAELVNAEQPGIAAFYPSLRRVVSRTTIEACTSLPLDVEYPMQGALAYDPEIFRLPLLSQVSVAEYLGYTQHTLLRDMDQMSMATSLEIREPFFDHELVSFVLNVPDRLKFPNYPKQLLVESLNGLIPDEIVRRKKQGFEFPWKIWMKNELNSFCEKYLKAAGERDFIHKKPLLQNWKKFLDNDPSVRWMELWLFVVLEYWLEKNNVR